MKKTKDDTVKKPEHFKRCANNHFYSEELDSCPECSVESTDISNKKENNSDAPEEPTFGESDDNSNENSQNSSNARSIPTKKDYSWWSYDDEYISGWTYFGRSILGTLLSVLLIGLYLNSVTAYKRGRSLGHNDTATLWGIWGFLTFFLAFTPLVVITNTIPHWYLWFSNGKNQSKDKVNRNQNSSKSDIKTAAFGTGKDSTSKNDIPGSFGEFGMVKTNPIPLNGVFTIYTYLPELRYSYTSKGTGKLMYFPVQFERTTDSDDTPIGSSISDFSGGSGATSAPNIGENIDVYNLYDQSGLKLAKIYLHGYQSYTSTQAPKGFYLSSEIPKEQDAVKVLDKFKNLPNK